MTKLIAKRAIACESVYIELSLVMFSIFSLQSPTRCTVRGKSLDKKDAHFSTSFIADLFGKEQQARGLENRRIIERRVLVQRKSAVARKGSGTRDFGDKRWFTPKRFYIMNQSDKALLAQMISVQGS